MSNQDWGKQIKTEKQTETERKKSRTSCRLYPNHKEAKDGEYSESFLT